MNKFKPTNATEKVLHFYFDSKVEISNAIGVSLPTIDKICDNEDIFYKYLHRIAKATDMKESKLLTSYWRFRDGL
tara:strand:+ start:30141 stop:30365 length:225 start_codon:yes stop_codon:yes gene_type:complete